MQLVIDIHESIYEAIKETPQTINRHLGKTMMLEHLMEVINEGTPLPKGHGRKFEKIVVDYPSPAICTYPEYRGKPYFSIQYEENGEHFIGYGTYNPDVLSRYLREYFIVQATTEADKEAEDKDDG